jgi:putative ABC transport system permease protein
MVLNILGGLAVFLSAFLVINTITGLLGQHVRHIGIMKAIGGRTTQIAAMYFGLAASFGLMALMIAAPLAALAAYGVAVGLSGFGNYEPGPFRVPLEALALQVVIALVVPLAAAAWPVLNSARLTVREAISTYGLGKGHFGTNWVDRLLVETQFAVSLLSRPLLISLRNAVRRKARLLLTLSTLTLAGAVFISVFNLWTTFDLTLAQGRTFYIADVIFTLARPYRIQKLAALIESVPGVAGAEGWGASTGQLVSAGQSDLEIIFITPPDGSQLIQPTMTSGRWLLPGDENAIVIGTPMLKQRPALKTGDAVIIKINDRPYPWRIIGTYKLAGNAPPLAYANYEYLARLRNEPDLAAELRITTAPHEDETTQTRVARAVEANFGQAGIQISQVITGTEWSRQQKSQFDIMIYFLLVMAVLTGMVGGLGLMGTMSMNVMERTREIGVMRAIGASNNAVLWIVIAEGLLIGLFSWVLAVVLSIPITFALNTGVGAALLSIPLDFYFGWNGVAMWLAGVLILGALASALPAWSAMRLTVREVLAYE